LEKEIKNQTRLPAEWEEQDAVLLAWPHEDTPWAPSLDIVQENFFEIISSIQEFEKVIVAVASSSHAASLKKKIPHGNLLIYETPSNDTWARDFGPLTAIRDGKPVLLDFSFNGWGRKYAFDKDNLITRNLHRLGAFGATRLEQVEFILEGGSIESDGEGTIIATSRCLLNPNRNPELSKTQIEDVLWNKLGAGRILWLEHGYLEGDDTDSHIDTLARFAPGGKILYVSCDNETDPHYKELKLMEEDLRSMKNSGGGSYQLLPLPWPEAEYYDKDERLPATYANFLVLNGAVLVPTYGDKKDPQALEIIGGAFPGRRIIGINCLPLIRKHGSLHCVTMQIPKGVL